MTAVSSPLVASASAFGDNVPEVLKMIENRKHLFRQPVIGPIGTRWW